VVALTTGMPEIASTAASIPPTDITTPIATAALLLALMTLTPSKTLVILTLPAPTTLIAVEMLPATPFPCTAMATKLALRLWVHALEALIASMLRHSLLAITRLIPLPAMLTPKLTTPMLAGLPLLPPQLLVAEDKERSSNPLLCQITPSILQSCFTVRLL